MNYSNPITQAQMSFLDSLYCERLSADPRNAQLLFEFHAPVHSGITELLRFCAFRDDLAGAPAVYYVVKNREGMILMVFALKCGVLFNTDYASELMDAHTRFCELKSAFRHDSIDEKTMEELRQIASMEQEYASLMTDLREDANPHHIRVAESIPAIELMLISTNSAARSYWKESGIDHGMGETLFWKFVAAKVLEISDLIGCSYLYTYLADVSEVQSLTNYFINNLRFEVTEKLGTAKGRFDFGCSMVYQRLHPDPDSQFSSDLRQNRRAFFDTFNYNSTDGDDYV